MKTRPRLFTLIFSLFVLTTLILMGCTIANAPNIESNSANSCPVTDPVWLKPPEDSAVQGSPAFGNYFANADQSILASAWWTEQEADQLVAREDGFKVGWFRPEGAELEITGQRLDAEAAPLEAHISCCYPTRFQATGLLFPTEGCWEVVAKAAESELSFTVWVEP